jgi:hypothetical protein
MTIRNLYVDASNVSHDLATVADYYSEPGVWHKVFVRTLGDRMYAWVQREDEAVAWDAAIHAQPPLLTSGDAPLGMSESNYFRINFLSRGQCNDGALQITDIEVKAWPPCVSGTEYYPATPSFTGAVQAQPSILDFGYVAPGSHADRTLKLYNPGTETASGWISVPAPFSAVGSDVYELASGNTATITLRFAPTESDKAYDETGYAVYKSTMGIRLIGQSIPPLLSANPEVLSFPNTKVN